MVKSSFDVMMLEFERSLEWASDSPYGELSRIVLELRDSFEELYGGGD